LQIFQLFNNSLTLVAAAPASVVLSRGWSPDSRWLAVADFDGEAVQVYSFGGKGRLKLFCRTTTGGPTMILPGRLMSVCGGSH